MDGKINNFYLYCYKMFLLGSVINIIHYVKLSLCYILCNYQILHYYSLHMMHHKQHINFLLYKILLGKLINILHLIKLFLHHMISNLYIHYQNMFCICYYIICIIIKINSILIHMLMYKYLHLIIIQLGNLNNLNFMVHHKSNNNYDNFCMFHQLMHIIHLNNYQDNLNHLKLLVNYMMCKHQILIHYMFYKEHHKLNINYLFL